MCGLNSENLVLKSRQMGPLKTQAEAESVALAAPWVRIIEGSTHALQGRWDVHLSFFEPDLMKSP